MLSPQQPEIFGQIVLGRGAKSGFAPRKDLSLQKLFSLVFEFEIGRVFSVGNEII
jgi:hypothetical protein